MATKKAQRLSDCNSRKTRSTINSLRVVVDTERRSLEGGCCKRGSKKNRAIVILDVRNSFNSAMTYNTNIYNIKGGIPLGSVLGPLFRNIMYDAVLTLPMPVGTETIDFADNIAVVIVTKYVEDFTQIANQAVLTIPRRFSTRGLQQTDHETGAFLMTSKKTVEIITLTIGGCGISSQPPLRYLGVRIASMLRFDGHLRTMSTKAGKVTNSLTRILPNISILVTVSGNYAPKSFTSYQCIQPRSGR